MDPDRKRQLLGSARVAELATIGTDGRPHLVPFCFALQGDTLVTAVDEKPKRSRNLKRIANIRANPRVAVLAHSYDEDWSALWWVRADGTAEVYEQGARHDRAIDLLVAKYEQYREARPRGPVIAITIERWQGWSPSLDPPPPVARRNT